MAIMFYKIFMNKLEIKSMVNDLLKLERKIKINTEDLEYIFSNNPNKKKNVYDKKIIQHLPDIHLNNLKMQQINYNFNPAEYRYQRSIDILRKDGSIITTIDPPNYSSNSKFSSTIVRDKMKAENYLRNFGIRTPISYVFDKDEMLEAKKEIFTENIEKVVIKPLYGSLGKGVMVNVSKDRFKENWDESTNFLAGSRKVLVQEYLPGFEARATVIEGNLVAVIVRTPPFVIGDNIHTLNQLIDISNEEKKECGVRGNLLIKKHTSMKEFLISNELTLDYIPKKDEFVLLGSVSNVSNGGELVNITDIVSNEIKEIALNTIASFNGMYTGGVDIIMQSYDDRNPVVLEVNAFPVLSITAFPTYGPQTKPSKTYIDAVIAVDQFRNDTIDKYNIDNETDLVRNYMNFVNRKKLLFDINYSKHSQYF